MFPSNGGSNFRIRLSSSIVLLNQRFRVIGESVRTSEIAWSGRRNVASGYVLYGSRTHMVLTTGEDVASPFASFSVMEICFKHSVFVYSR